MEKNKSEMLQPPVVGYPPPYAFYPPEDEISLVDLWLVLVKRKYMLLGVIVAVTLGSVLYALQLAPLYKAEATFLPATASDIQVLNIPEFRSFMEAANDISASGTLDILKNDTDFHAIDIESVYALFEKNLRSRSSKRSVFENMKLFDRIVEEGDREISAVEIFEKFNKGITVTVLKQETGQKSVQPISLSMEGKDPVLTVEIINRLGKAAERATTAEIIAGIQAKVSARKKDLKQKIALLGQIAKKQRLDEIERFEVADALERAIIQDKITSLRNQIGNERHDKISRLQAAAKIARSLDIVKPVTINVKNSSSPSSLNESQGQVDILTEERPLYTLGHQALEAEIGSLSNRIVDDPFIPEIRGLQERLKLLEKNRKVDQLKSRLNEGASNSALQDKKYELAWLKSIDIDPLAVKTIRVDQAAYAPKYPIKPNRRLIVILGLMLGLMLGVFAAFFVNFIENQKESQA